MGTCPLNQNVDNLHKHGELFVFSELLVKFPGISDDILLTMASVTKTKKMDQVEEKQYKEIQNWEGNDGSSGEKKRNLKG
jgi:hypothetical protein